MGKQAGQGTKAVLNEYVDLITVAKGMVVSYIVTLVVFIIFSFILTCTSFPEKYISTVVIITTIVSILVAGSTATKNVKNKGWLNGAIVGLAYMAILYILGSLAFSNFAIDKYVVTMGIIGIATGSIGGIVGINLKGGSRSRR